MVVDKYTIELIKGLGLTPVLTNNGLLKTVLENEVELPIEKRSNTSIEFVRRGLYLCIGYKFVHYHGNGFDLFYENNNYKIKFGIHNAFPMKGSAPIDIKIYDYKPYNIYSTVNETEVAYIEQYDTYATLIGYGLKTKRLNPEDINPDNYFNAIVNRYRTFKQSVYWTDKVKLAFKFLEPALKACLEDFIRDWLKGLSGEITVAEVLRRNNQNNIDKLERDNKMLSMYIDVLHEIINDKEKELNERGENCEGNRLER